VLFQPLLEFHVSTSIQVELRRELHAGADVGAHRHDGHLPQCRSLHVIEWADMDLSVDGALPAHQFAIDDLGADRQLPVGARPGLLDDALRLAAGRKNLAVDEKRIALNARPDHADPVPRPVLVVGEQRH
jgi:hypothetical protein